MSISVFLYIFALSNKQISKLNYIIMKKFGFYPVDSNNCILFGFNTCYCDESNLTVSIDALILVLKISQICFSHIVLFEIVNE